MFGAQATQNVMDGPELCWWPRTWGPQREGRPVKCQLVQGTSLGALVAVRKLHCVDQRVATGLVRNVAPEPVVSSLPSGVD